MVSLYEQFNSFLVTVSTGLIMGLVYDIYWLLRYYLHFRKIGTGIGDLIFWSITTALAFFLLLVGNWGEVRLYVFLGILVGLGLYLRWLSPVARRLLVGLVQVLVKLITIIVTVILWPFRLLRKLVLVPLGFLGMALHRVLSGGKRVTRRFVAAPVARGIQRHKQWQRKHIRGLKARLHSLWSKPKPPEE